MTSESRGELQNAPTHNFNSFNRTDEHSETDVQPALNTSENQGMSLFEMFDACLNSIRQNDNGDKNRLSSLNERMNGSRREHLSALLQKSPLSATQNREASDTKLYEIPESENEVRESREGLEKANIEANSNISIEHQEEKKQPDAEEMQRVEVRVEKLKRIFERHYLRKWRYTSFIDYKQNYEEDFDLIHGNIEGLEGFGDLDSSQNINREQRFAQEDLLIIADDDNQDMISKEFDQENLLSDKLSFGNLNLSEGDRYFNFSNNSLAQAHFNRKPKIEAPIVEASVVQTAGSNKKANKKGMSTEFMSSPRIIGKSSGKVSSLRNSLQEKENIKDRKNINTMKSPKRELPKKEEDKSDKPKMGLKPLAAKTVSRGGSFSAKGPVTTKLGLPPSNKEGSFAMKATPVKMKKTVLGGNK